MKQSSVKWFAYLFSFVFLILSCAGTELTHKQVNDAYKGKPVSNILVIAMMVNDDTRRIFEKKFVAHLKSAGVEAISSVDAIPMPVDLELKKETIFNAANQFKNDAVIITHLIDKEEKDVFTRGGRGYRGYHGSYAYDRGYSSTRRAIRLEMNLYDVKTEELIWSGQSKTWSKDSRNRIINDVIKVVINDLQNNKLISPK
jgi:PBP1b-binding outer membrane lipoprotein LpoB